MNTTSADMGKGMEKATAISSRFLKVLQIPQNPKQETPSEGQQYSDLMEALGVAVYTTDAAGVITYFNEAAAELWGRRPEIGKPKANIGRHDPDECDAGKVVPLGDHLRTDEHVDRSGSHRPQNVGRGALAPDGIAIEPCHLR